MIDLIRKRHSGNGWAVLTELANSTGGNIKGFADAFAIGIWPSTGYESHLYEVKISRADLQRELEDPTKADAVGKFADFRWLVVSDVKITETLVIPEGWGILTPKGGGDAMVLRVVRPAPKQEAVTWTRGFCAAMIRHVYAAHVPKAEFEAAKDTVTKELRARVEREVSWEHQRLKQSHDELLKQVRDFQEKSGVDIRTASWSLGNVGEAVRLICAAQHHSSTRLDFERMAEAHAQMATTARQVAALLTPREDADTGMARNDQER